MIDAFRSEWIKLGRRNFLWGGFGTLIGFALLMTLTAIFTADADAAAGAVGPPGGFGGGVDLSSAGGYLSGLSQAASFLGIITLALFASNIAAEFSTGSIRVLLTTQPRRAQMLGGKLMAMGAFVVLAILYAAIVSGVVAFLLAGSQGVDTAAWTTGEAVGAGLSIFGNVTIAAFVYGLFGAMLGMITKSSAISIAAGVAYFLLGETLLLQPLWDQVEKWFPAGVLSAFASGGSETVPYLNASLLVAVFALATWLATTLVLNRRDIVD